jgi:hypothetical protein
MAIDVQLDEIDRILSVCGLAALTDWTILFGPTVKVTVILDEWGY